MQERTQKMSSTEFKKHFLRLVDEVKNQKRSFIITKRNSPVAEIIPLRNNTLKSDFGCMKGMMKINCDLVNTSFEDDWEANHD